MYGSRDLSRDDWIKEFIKRKWSSGLFWAVGAAAKKKGSGPIMSSFLGCFFQLFVIKKKNIYIYFVNRQVFWKMKFFQNLLLKWSCLMKKIRKIQIILVLSLFTNFLKVFWSLAKNLPNFVSLPWKIDNPHCQRP